MKAKNFKLKDMNNKEYELKTIKEKYKILYFYPKDNTPGCTIEANDFTALKKDFEKLNAKIIGISGGNEKTKCKFVEKHDLKILLLSDTDFKVSEKYGTYKLKKFMGREYMGINRETFILDEKNNIIKHYPKVKAKGHAQEVLNYLKEL